MLVRHSLLLCSTFLVATPFLTCANFCLVIRWYISTPFLPPEFVVLLDVHVVFQSSVRVRKHPNGLNGSNRRGRGAGGASCGRSPPKKTRQPQTSRPVRTLSGPTK